MGSSFVVMISLLLGEREHDSHGGAGTGRTKNVKLALKLRDPLTHARDSDAERYGIRGFGQNVKQTDAIVPDFHRHRVRVAFDTHGHGGGPGVTVNIGERFLDDAENSEFEFLFEAAEVISKVYGDGDTSTFGKELGIGSNRRHQTGFLQEWWMQERRDEADFAHGGAGQAGGGAEQFVHLAVPRWEASGNRGERHLQAGQSLRSGFVQFAADAALLLGADGEQLMGQAAKVGLSVSQGGDVPSDADHPDDLSAGVSQRSTDALEDTNRMVIRTGISFGKTEGTAGANRGSEVGSKLFDILEIQRPPKLLDGRPAGDGRNSKESR
ncbi:MAG TPA: hypothetical protein VGD60_02810 [Candidatus Acidoferrales bacterium]